MATIASIDDSQIGTFVGEDLDLSKRFPEGVTVVWIARKAAHTDHEALVQRGGHAHLAAKLMSRTRTLPLEMQ